MSLTVVADENIPELEHFLGDRWQVHRLPGRQLHSEQLVAADALLVRSVTPVDDRLLAGSTVRFVGSATSGVDHIDRPWLASAGIEFSYAPGSNANSVVEYVLSAIATVSDCLERLVAGSTVGIVGYGHVGRALAARLRSLGIAVRVFDPWLEQSEIEDAADLTDILACDVISLHCELTEALPWPSRHLIGQRELKQMSAGTLLINAARGPVVDNVALLRILREGGGPVAVLDCWEGEPDINVALLEAVALGTPHVAGYSLDGKVLATRMLCESLSAFFDVPLATADSPLASPEPIVTTGRSDKAALIRQLLLHSHDPLRDDAMLRGALIGAGSVEARERFDELRKSYPQRRELAGRTVLTADPVAAVAEVVSALECRLNVGAAGSAEGSAAGNVSGGKHDG